MPLNKNHRQGGKPQIARLQIARSQEARCLRGTNWPDKTIWFEVQVMQTRKLTRNRQKKQNTTTRPAGYIHKIVQFQNEARLDQQSDS